MQDVRTPGITHAFTFRTRCGSWLASTSDVSPAFKSYADGRVIDTTQCLVMQLVRIAAQMYGSREVRCSSRAHRCGRSCRSRAYLPSSADINRPSSRASELFSGGKNQGMNSNWYLLSVLLRQANPPNSHATLSLSQLLVEATFCVALGPLFFFEETGWNIISMIYFLFFFLRGVPL